MFFPLNFSTALERVGLTIASAALGWALLAGSASAESAYVPQANAGALIVQSLPIVNQRGATSVPAGAARTTSFVPTPETAPPNTGGRNFAQTVQIGSYNQAATVQTGRNDISAINVIGQRNNVGVLQAGSNLISNVVMLGTQGLNVGVIQPNGSAPVNMLIARLPNGALLIKR
jgi:hypothetical protein